jgi:hypothetical protein
MSMKHNMLNAGQAVSKGSEAFNCGIKSGDKISKIKINIYCTNTNSQFMQLQLIIHVTY